MSEKVERQNLPKDRGFAVMLRHPETYGNPPMNIRHKHAPTSRPSRSGRPPGSMDILNWLGFILATALGLGAAGHALLRKSGLVLGPGLGRSVSDLSRGRPHFTFFSA